MPGGLYYEDALVKPITELMLRQAATSLEVFETNQGGELEGFGWRLGVKSV